MLPKLRTADAACHCSVSPEASFAFAGYINTDCEDCAIAPFFEIATSAFASGGHRQSHSEMATTAASSKPAISGFANVFDFDSLQYLALFLHSDGRRTTTPRPVLESGRLCLFGEPPARYFTFTLKVTFFVFAM